MAIVESFPVGGRVIHSGVMDVRRLTAGEEDELGRTVLAAFHRELEDHDRERYARIDEVDRMLGAFDAGRMAGGAAAFTRRLTVPGAIVDCAAVTGVGVRPTHRRRGLLTQLMRRQLADIRDRGEPIAALWASEGAIYGRFGYGPAARAAQLVVHRAAGAPRPAAEPAVAGPAGDHLEAMRAVHERVRAERPGMLDREGPWWQDRLYDPEARREGAQPLQAVVVPDGYALYAVAPRWSDRGPDGEVRVRELVAGTPHARAALWAFLLDQDLTSSARWHIAPTDEPLWLMLDDPRRAELRVGDGLWVRVVAVAAALSARTYPHDPDIVLEVADDVCPWNAGRWHVGAHGCEATDAPADLALGAAALGAAYLGGTTLLELGAAGKVKELRAGALQRASGAFRADVAPWCPEVF
jgi:predicted acetyltransferase